MIVEKLDRLHAEIYRDLQRNCSQDYFESSMTKGATETTKQGALENIGQLLALTCLSKTELGYPLITAKRGQSTARDVDDDRDVAHTLILFLASLEWIHDERPKVEVDNAQRLFCDIMRDIDTFFSREKGNNLGDPEVQIVHLVPILHETFWKRS